VHGSGIGAEAQGDVGDHLPKLRVPILPFKLNQDRCRHIPRQQHKVTNWPAYDASLRQRGSLTVWFTDEAIAAWAAEPRTTRGGQPWYSPLAILTALTLRAVFRLAYRQAEGLIGSIVSLLGLGLRVPDHTTLSRRAATLEVPRPGNGTAARLEGVTLSGLIRSEERLVLAGVRHETVSAYAMHHAARHRTMLRPPNLAAVPSIATPYPTTSASSRPRIFGSWRGYGIHTFDWAADWAARAKPAAMAANCAHPARMVLGPGGL